MDKSNSEKSTVLAVDDDTFIQQIVKDTFSEVGFNVITAESAEQVYQLIEENIPDVFIVDIILPGQDGFELCANLRRNAKTRDVPILILSSKFNVEDRVKGLQIGADDYIVKPFHLEELVARVNALIRRVKRHEVTTKHRLEDTDDVQIPKEGLESIEDKKVRAHNFFKRAMFEEAHQLWVDLFRLKPKDQEAKRYLEITRVRLMKKYMELLHSKDAIPVRTSNYQSSFIGLDLNTEEGFIFSRIDGEIDCKSIVSISAMAPIKVYGILYNFKESGVIKIKGS